MPVIGLPPGRSSALILGWIMRIAHCMGWPLHCWPCTVGWLLWNGRGHGFLIVWLEARPLPCPIALHVAIAVALRSTRSAWKAVVLRFRSILEVLIMPLALWVH